jgi:FAD/FMN-containing dehydrogenase
MTVNSVEAFCQDISGIETSTGLRERQMKSKDFHWYSPILTPILAGCLADVVVRPHSVDELRTVVSAAVKRRLPITLRGGGTGNYGQAVPLKGGIVLEMTRLTRVLEVKPGHMRAEAGIVIRAALESALTTGQQLMMYPSTMQTATIGGYLCGGFAGIGSVKHGIIRDSGMIKSLKIMTVEEEPKIVEIESGDTSLIFHSWGTCGIVIEVTLGLVPEQSWIDCIATFPTYGETIAFGNAAFDSGLDIFLLSAVEKRFSPFYKSTQQYFDGTRDAMFSMVNAKDVDAYFDLVAKFNGRKAIAVSQEEGHRSQLRPIHKTAFNHTTLMALQVDRGWTYLQVVMPNPFTPELAEAQLKRFGDEVLMHHEYTREHGKARIGGLPLIRYSTEARLSEIMKRFEDDGCVINNPHVFKLEDGGRFDPDGKKLRFRQKVDPNGLLNPGKLRSVS